MNVALVSGMLIAFIVAFARFRKEPPPTLAMPSGCPLSMGRFNWRRDW